MNGPEKANPTFGGSGLHEKRQNAGGVGEYLKFFRGEVKSTNISQFLRAVLALEDDALPPGQFIGIVEKTPGGMRRTACATTTKAAAVVARIGRKACCYFETATGPKAVQGGRLRAAEAFSVGHVRLDVDLASLHRAAGKRLPASEAEALAVLHQLLEVLPTSVTVRTGHGLHAYWAFKEPIDLTCERERLAYQRAAAHLHAFASDLMRRAGFSNLDNVADLARIMRLPGSFNCKDPSSPRLVTFVDHGPRYSCPGDVLDALPELELPQVCAKAPLAIISGHDAAHVRAEAARIIRGLLDFEAEDEPAPNRRLITKAWNRTALRGDNSQSAHDWRFACSLLQSGLVWTPAELAAALVLYREACATALAAQGGQLAQYAPEIRKKARRLDYLRRTVGAALAAVRGAS